MAARHATVKSPVSKRGMSVNRGLTAAIEAAAKVVSRVIPGILDSIEITPELIQRARKVADNCDAEIIRFHGQA